MRERSDMERDAAQGLRLFLTEVRANPETHQLLTGLGVGAALTIASALAIIFLDRVLQVHSPSMMFLCAVILAAAWHGQRVALATAVFAFGVYNFYLVEPRYTFGLAGADDILTLLVFVTAAIFVGGTAGRLRDQERRARDQASIFRVLLGVSRDLTLRRSIDQSFDDVLTGARRLGVEYAVVISRDENQPLASTGTDVPVFIQDLARNIFSENRTDMHELGSWRLMPLTHLDRPVAVFGYKAAHPHSEDREIALGLLADLGRTAIQAHLVAKQQVEVQSYAAAEKLRSALLASMSHDFRTPLSTITASASTLLARREKFSRATQSDLLASIQEEAERLDRFVSNILSMTRLDANALRVRADWVDPLDTLDAAVGRISKRLGQRRLEMRTPAAVPSVFVDHLLLEQALTNILENALVHAPPSASIQVGCEYDDAQVTLWVEDDGPGVPSDDLERIFDKFHRLGHPSDSTLGAGLGLAISKGLVEAMDGEVWAAQAERSATGLRIAIAFKRSTEETAP